MHILIKFFQKQRAYIGVVIISNFIIGCGLYNKQGMKKEGEGVSNMKQASYRENIELKSINEENWKEKLKEKLENLPKDTKIVFFLQAGLGENVETMNFLQEGLSEKGYTTVHILKNASSDSLHRPMEEQAQIIVDEINNKNIDFDSTFLGLIGYSHGGVVLQVVVDKIKKEEKAIDLFDITINSPLRGVPVLEKTCEDVQENFGDESVQEGLGKVLVSIMPNIDVSQIIGSMQEIVSIKKKARGCHSCLSYIPFNLPFNLSFNGVFDLEPNSDFLNKVERILEEKTDEYKTLLYSRCDDLGRIFNISNDDDIQKATLACKQLVADGGTHDLLVPTSSQWAEGIGVNNTAIHRREITSDDLAHARNVIIFGRLPRGGVSFSVLSKVPFLSSFLTKRQFVELPPHINVVLEYPGTVEEVWHSTYNSVLAISSRNG